MANLFSFIIGPMETGLVWLSLLVASAGVGIILFTVFVRAVLAPLQITQLRNAKAMQRLQPKLAELKKKHGSDRQKLQEETMALYKEHGVNPAMGCLPMLIQLPILFGLFYALQHLGSSPPGWPHPNWVRGVSCNGHTVHTMNAWLEGCYKTAHMPGNVNTVFDLFHAQFLWLSNGLGGSDPYFILPILAGLTQWLQSRMMLQRSTDPQQQMMNTMMNFMPLMIVFFAIRYPAGLALYWVTSTVIGILIQFPITGWGLVPILGSGTLPGLGGRSKPVQPKKPTPRSEPKPLPAEGLGPVSTNGTTNGADGQSSNGSAAPRPRKKANRARGGKSGGRRG